MKKMYQYWLIFMIWQTCSSQQTADPLANNKTKDILAFISGLPQQGKYLH